MAIDTATAKQHLLTRKAELEELRRISGAARDAVALDQQSVGRLSRMDAMQQQAMAQATERQRARELAEIDVALRRIDAGEYGYCAACDEAIAEKRLENNPAASLCIACASRLGH